jgi:hypothetical protein
LPAVEHLSRPRAGLDVETEMPVKRLKVALQLPDCFGYLLACRDDDSGYAELGREGLGRPVQALGAEIGSEPAAIPIFTQTSTQRVRERLRESDDDRGAADPEGDAEHGSLAYQMAQFGERAPERVLDHDGAHSAPPAGRKMACTTLLG